MNQKPSPTIVNELVDDLFKILKSVFGKYDKRNPECIDDVFLTLLDVCFRLRKIARIHTSTNKKHKLLEQLTCTIAHRLQTHDVWKTVRAKYQYLVQILRFYTEGTTPDLEEPEQLVKKYQIIYKDIQKRSLHLPVHLDQNLMHQLEMLTLSFSHVLEYQSTYCNQHW